MMAPHKRLIVCCDGTWMNSDNGYDEKTKSLATPSNVTRFARAVSSVDKRAGGEEISQIVYYQAGVGSNFGLWDKLSGGSTGSGLDELIREAYAFIAKNWSPGDQIFIIGYSRGAFTARSISGFISNVGLLTNAGLEHFYRIFKDYENMKQDNYKNPVPGLDIPQNCLPMATHQNHYVDFLRNGPQKPSGKKWVPLTSGTIPEIQAIGVWDTVGSLGIPGVFVVDQVKKWLHINNPRDELRFYDTNLAPNVLHAFQALALDEMRYSFEPAVWERPAGMTTKLKQVWFPGVHSNVGGGMTDQELSNITLAWMMSQLDPWIDFDKQYIGTQFPAAQTNGTDPALSPRPWSCGSIDTSQNSWIYGVAGNHMVRTPGQYLAIDVKTGYPKKDVTKKLSVPLVDTQERIHSSVRIRLARGGLGINDKKAGYKAEALTPHHVLNFRGAARHGWKIERVESKADIEAVETLQKDFPDEEHATFLWRPTGPAVPSNFAQFLIEDVPGNWERQLLAKEPDVHKDYWNVLPQKFS